MDDDMLDRRSPARAIPPHGRDDAGIRIGFPPRSGFSRESDGKFLLFDFGESGGWDSREL